MNRLLLAASSASGAVAVTLAAGAFTLAPVPGARTALPVSSAHPAAAVRGAHLTRRRPGPRTARVLPGQPMIPLPAATSHPGTSSQHRTAARQHHGAAGARDQTAGQQGTTAGHRGDTANRHRPAAVPHRGAARSRRRSAMPVSRSVNWSGYTVTRGGKAFRLVRATFFVPYLNCTVSPRTYSADWVGLDGYFGKRPDSVEQDGVEADCVGHAGKTPSYRAWYEMFPQPERVRSIRVRAGDSVTASVSYDQSSRQFTLAVTDNTSGHRFTVTKACAAASCPRNSAQAISEAPAGGRNQLLPLADYGAVSFTGIHIADAAGQAGSLLSRHWRTTRIVQYGDASRKRIAQPTAIHGAGFANYWLGDI